MCGKRIYSDDLKLEIVKRYLKGDIGLNSLAVKYHVGKSDIQKWKAAYAEHGISGLTTRNRTYSGDFKVSVVEYMHTTESSIRQTAAHFNIPSHPTIANWERIYYELGKEALYIERRGRTLIMENRKSKKSIQSNEDLLAEVQRLRMENEYLKKLNALVQEREKSEKKIK